MDPYSLIQEQLASINNTLTNGLNKLHNEISQLSRKVDSLESSSNDASVTLESLRQGAELIPKIYSNQVGVLETLLVGHQYQFRRLSNIVSRDNDSLSFTDPTTTSNFHNSGLPNTINSNTNPSSANNSNTTSQDDDLNPDGNVSTSDTTNRLNGSVNGSSNPNQPQSLGISPSNRVNSPNTLQHQSLSQQSQVNQVNSNRISSSPVNLTLLTSNQGQIQPRRNRTTLSSLRSFTSMLPIENDSGVLPITQTHTQTSHDDANSILGEVGTDDDSARRLWDSVPFRRLNPNPKSVEEVLNEYYIGYQGQPPLKYLEEHRKEWRKGNKNLSKTFCRRYRIITAVEAGTRLYARDYAISESEARDRTVAELENSRVKENGRKETMYWLFHHVPNHLKRR